MRALQDHRHAARIDPARGSNEIARDEGTKAVGSRFWPLPLGTALRSWRSAILLIGGDKAGQWNRWYRTMVPIADELYSRYLQELKEEGLL